MSAVPENRSVAIACYGLAVNPVPYLGDGGGLIFAEVVPSGARWPRTLLPSVRRWWWEVHRVAEDGGGVTHAYEEGGSGGAYTLRGAIGQAIDAVNDRSGFLERKVND